MQPVRHALGALLLDEGLVDEAYEVYRQDLILLRPTDGSLAAVPAPKERLVSPWRNPVPRGQAGRRRRRSVDDVAAGPHREQLAVLRTQLDGCRRGARSCQGAVVVLVQQGAHCGSSAVRGWCGRKLHASAEQMITQ
jgi:hypothetical protein